jgi:3-oxoacyl-[acyl-carrier protein] reductase
MKNYLLIGAGSDIATQTAHILKNEGVALYGTTRNLTEIDDQLFDHTLEIDPVNDDFPKDFLPEQLDGMVYFPGTVNLKPFKMLKDKDFNEDLGINLFGLIKALRWVLPALTRSEKASVVMFSTVAVAQGMPYHSSIATAKGAVEGLAKSLAAEYAPKIRFNCIAPSLTETKLVERLVNSEEKKTASRDRHPLRAIGDATDMAEATAFLLSSKSKWMTGQVLGIDGGISSLRVK